jgi:predicted nucleotide-binding protein
MPNSKVSEVLDLEHLRLTGAIEEINREYQRKMTEVAADYRRRGLGISGPFAKAIAETHMARAKAIIGKHLELRRETVSKVPDVGTDESYQALTAALERSIDTASQSIADDIQRQMGAALDGPPAASITRRREVERGSLKAFARREVEILKRESHMRVSRSMQQQGEALPASERNPRKVWVVYGRNEAARRAMFQFLRAIGLEPLEWHEATALAQAGAPYVGEVLDRAFAEVQGVVVLLTGDDLAHLRREFVKADDGPHEATPTPQARPNVLFEAGMAFGRHPESTILVTLGYTRPFSDVAGRHTIKISNAIAHRQVLAARLKTIGCAVVTETRTDWHEAGDFDAAVPKPQDSAASDETAVQEPALALQNENQTLRAEIRQLNTMLAETVDAEPCPRCRRKGWHVESSEPDPEFGDLGAVRRLYKCELCGFTENQLKTVK